MVLLEEVKQTELVEFCQSFLQIPSFTGQEQETAQLLAAEMEKLGFDSVWTDGVGNVIGEIRGSRPGPKLLFDGHMDTITVSGSEEWTVDPFGGELKAGRLYGRGAVGMKGALASMIYGLAPLAQHKARLAGSIFVSGTVGAEQFAGLSLVQVIQAVKPQYVIIGEASALEIKYGGCGRAEIAVTTLGQGAHSAYAHTGKNAGYMMLRLVQEILKIPAAVSKELGSVKLELTNVISAPYPAISSVPHKCWATFDRGLLNGETNEIVLSEIKEVIKKLQAEDPQFRVEVEIVEDGLECYTGQYLSAKRFFPAWLTPKEDPLVTGSVAALNQLGLAPALSTYAFSTNGCYARGVAGLPTIGFGPGCGEELHRADESIGVSELIVAAKGYQAIACYFLCS